MSCERSSVFSVASFTSSMVLLGIAEEKSNYFIRQRKGRRVTGKINFLKASRNGCILTES